MQDVMRPSEWKGRRTLLAALLWLTPAVGLAQVPPAEPVVPTAPTAPEPQATPPVAEPPAAVTVQPAPVPLPPAVVPAAPPVPPVQESQPGVATPAPVLAAPPPASPSAPTSLIPTASFISRYEFRQHYNRIGLSDSDSVKYRARFGLNTAPMSVSDDLSLVVRFVPQASGSWGIGGDTLEDAALDLHEGLIMLQSSHFRLDVGRMELNYGDAFILGNVDWNVTGRSFDAVRVRATPGDTGAFIDTFLSLLKEGNVPVPAMGAAPALPGQTEPFATDDVYFGGVYAGVGPMLAKGLALDLYALAKVATVAHDALGVQVDESTRYTLGVRAKQKVDIFDYRLEVGVQLGSQPGDVSVFAYQGDVEAGINVLDDTLRFAVEGFYASGNDPTTADKNEGWDQLYPTAHKWLGFMDVFAARSNVAGAALHLGYGFATDWKLGVDAHFFLRPEDTAAPGGVIESGYAATEIDTGVSYTIAKGLHLRGAYDIFLPNEDRFGTTDVVHFVETELRYDM